MLEIIRTRQESGVTVIFVSHRLDEILEIASRVTVLRDGRVVATVERSDLSREQLVHMLGGVGEHHEHLGGHLSRAATPRLELQSVSGFGLTSAVNLSIDPGEIVGLAGLAGSGRTTLAEMIVGGLPTDSGRMLLDGHPVHIRDRRDASRQGIVMLPASRAHAIVPNFGIPPNITLGNAHQYSRSGVLLDKRREKATAARYIAQLKIKTAKSDSRVRYLSGGNQQKVLLARVLDLKPRLLILDEPTAGIDISTKEYIYQLVRQLADSGISQLFISSELDELPLVADRILIFDRGRITAELTGNTTRSAIVSCLFREHPNGVVGGL
jgi:ABC-type sugar transport system ATPase subunit